MATITITSSSSSSSSAHDRSIIKWNISKTLLVFLFFISFIFVTHLCNPNPTSVTDESKMMTAMDSSSLITRRFLSQPSTTSPTSTTHDDNHQHSSTNTMNLNPHGSSTRTKNSSKQFEASDHEVPSGPNPISNR
ncbi:hypothetical protein C5167_015239 [Papaver somniferum]|uniref:Uncharacterized protein n=1 Tax=Papaver somniferum TaxID=3469 RepID=A0A4Y7J5G1_PAPSO|nr:hypothetical protein C5167_015239 [Papaver somniferum]